MSERFKNRCGDNDMQGLSRALDKLWVSSFCDPYTKGVESSSVVSHFWDLYTEVHGSSAASELMQTVTYDKVADRYRAPLEVGEELLDYDMFKAWTIRHCKTCGLEIDLEDRYVAEHNRCKCTDDASGLIELMLQGDLIERAGGNG